MATLLTEKFVEMNKTSSVGVHISSLLLFDAPIFGDILHSDDSVLSKSNDPPDSDVVSPVSHSMDGFVLAHFRYITSMLANFYEDETSTFFKLSHGKPIHPNVLGHCNVVVFRAAQEESSKGLASNDTIKKNNGDIGLFQQLTLCSMSDVVLAPGTHWTMLFNENVLFVADTIKQRIPM